MAEIQRIADLSALDELLDATKDGTLWLFKHSLTCPISAHAWHEFQGFVANQPDGDGTTFALIEIQYARPVSKAVADRTGVRHESPQAILLRAGQVSWHASHSGIHVRALQNA